MRMVGECRLPLLTGLTWMVRLARGETLFSFAPMLLLLVLAARCFLKRGIDSIFRFGLGLAWVSGQQRFSLLEFFSPYPCLLA